MIHARLRLIGFIAALLIAIRFLDALGAGLLEPPLVAGGGASIIAWVNGRDTATAVFAIVRIGALAMAWYLLLTISLGALFGLARAARPSAVIAAISLPPVRRIIRAAAGATIGVSVLASAATTGAGASTAAASPPPTMRRLPDQPSATSIHPTTTTMTTTTTTTTTTKASGPSARPATSPIPATRPATATTSPRTTIPPAVDPPPPGKDDQTQTTAARVTTLDSTTPRRAVAPTHRSAAPDAPVTTARGSGQAPPTTPLPAPKTPASGPHDRPMDPPLMRRTVEADQAEDPAWTVRPGDSFWRIAASHLAIAWQREPSDVEIDPYWRVLIAANRSRLAHPHDPDLLFPGQQLSLPPVPSAAAPLG